MKAIGGAAVILAICLIANACSRQAERTPAPVKCHDAVEDQHEKLNTIPPPDTAAWSNEDEERIRELVQTEWTSRSEPHQLSTNYAKQLSDFVVSRDTWTLWGFTYQPAMALAHSNGENSTRPAIEIQRAIDWRAVATVALAFGSDAALESIHSAQLDYLCGIGYREWPMKALKWLPTPRFVRMVAHGAERGDVAVVVMDDRASLKIRYAGRVDAESLTRLEGVVQSAMAKLALVGKVHREVCGF